MYAHLQPCKCSCMYVDVYGSPRLTVHVLVACILHNEMESLMDARDHIFYYLLVWIASLHCLLHLVVLGGP